ncbi:hypothetical protein O7627_20735 [Solwaraspora sp. WMMD1047]|uniref:3-hydroxyacyl-ACP dehydratase FabZ family protein n=1 Tax=Solwaraspora sp. WMMD1047 TaxID=3016102 RepID=UPI002417A2E2|nr:hypothetical protein [Solwaraspora sp. WMMD1047]MDG4831710.1 hypothetical protein [Solwaraspora sp. WMMD1047]
MTDLTALATPLGKRVQVRERHSDGLTATYLVDDNELVLSGHFPGFAIFPGVCLIECAHQAALLALPPGMTLASVERVRFHSPVFPGDEITVRLTIADRTGTARLTVRRPGVDQPLNAADIRLRYRERDDREHR